MSASPTPAVAYRAFATAKLVRRSILEELRREPGAHVWGHRITHGPQLLQYASAKMLEELHEVLELTGNLPNIARIKPESLLHLLEELADVREVMGFMEDNFLPQLSQPPSFHPVTAVVQWDIILAAWQSLKTTALIPQHMHGTLIPLLAQTGSLLANVLQLLASHRFIPPGHQSPLNWAAVEAAGIAKNLKKGPIVPFYLEAVSLPATSQWCAVFAQKLPELNPASLNPNTRVPPHSLAA